MSDKLIGSTLASQFRILRQLGEGGMGAVFVAEQLGMDRQVVVKLMHAELTTGQKAVERFKREARAVAALNHPNIVMVYTFGQTEEGQLFQAMELIDGRDIAHELRQGPFAEERALKIIEQVLEALIDAHSRGIVHRDLKPENIMLTARYGNPDHVKVLDFGIAKVMDQDADQPALTREGAVFGTPRYMAPEQVRGQPVDVRTDLYPLGLVLFEMLTGQHPFGTRAALDYMVAHASEPIAPPPGVTRATAAILARALAKDPADRYQSAREMRDAVRAALAGEAPVVERPVRAAVVSPARGATKRAWWPWVVVGLLVAGGGVGVAVALSGATTSKPIAATTSLATNDPIEDPVEDPIEDPIVGEDPTDPPPEDPVDAPTTDVEAGADIEGFPVPFGATLASTDEIRLTLVSELTPKKVIEFYQAAFHQRGWPWEKFPNGLMLTGEQSAFKNINLMRTGKDTTIYIQRRTNEALMP